MNNALGIDPFNLRELIEDIDRRTYRIMADDFPTIVPQEGIDTIRAKLLEEVRTLMGELMNDILHLQRELGIDDIVNERDKIYSVVKMVQHMASVYSVPAETGNEEQDWATARQWCVARVKWIISGWFQVYSNLVQRLSKDNPMAVQVLDAEGTADTLVSYPRPMELEVAMDTWQLTKTLSLEYLQAKADLLRAFGKEVPVISINFEPDGTRLLDVARKAFWQNEPHTAMFILQAMRDVFLRILGLKGLDAPVDLRLLSTDQLPLLAHAAGVDVPFSPAVLHNIALNLETCQAYCGRLPISSLYPMYRVAIAATEKLLSVRCDPMVRERAVAILKQGREATDGA